MTGLPFDDHLPKRVRHTLDAWLRPGCRVLVAFSGGMDSTVLLDVLHGLRSKMAFDLAALHVHHGLSPNADDWANFCGQFCADRNIPLTIKSLALTHIAGKGTERAAREGRYALLADADADIVCCAHHRDDQAETVLLNLFRGSAIHGLAAMPANRAFAGKRLIRPLLDVPRSDLLAWARQRNLRWVEDESNQNLDFRRNHLRHRVLLEIQASYPGIAQVLARTAGQMSVQAQLLDRLAVQDALACTDNRIIRASLLAKLPVTAAQNVLRYLLMQRGIRLPSQARLKAFVAQLPNARADAAIQVALGGATLHLWRDQLWLDTVVKSPLPEAVALGAGDQHWPDGRLSVQISTQSADALPGKWRLAPVSQVREGQRFKPAKRRHALLSELLRAQGIPAWVRWRLPALWHNADLCWVAGLGWAADTPVECSRCLQLDWESNGLGALRLAVGLAAEI